MKLPFYAYFKTKNVRDWSPVVTHLVERVLHVGCGSLAAAWVLFRPAALCPPFLS